MEQYLSHHGILGQKWGVRRFQNEDGTLTDAGKKRYFKNDGSFKNRGIRNLNKMAKSVTDSKDLLSVEKEKKKLLNYLNSSVINKSKISELKILRKKYLDALAKDVEYLYSDQLEKDTDRAYKKTYEWFQKNDEQLLNEMIKKNNGSKNGLDYFHDFRKTLEGFESDELEKGEKRYNQMHPEMEQYRKEAEDARSAYNKAKHNLAYDFVQGQEKMLISDIYQSNSTLYGKKYITSNFSVVLSSLDLA